MESMALSLEHLGLMELPYGTPRTLNKMSSGFSNHNYLLTTSLGSYRVRVSQYSTHVDELQAEKMILNWAANKNNLIVPMLGLFKLPSGTDISIFPYLDADSKFNINNEALMREAGKILADYHLTVIGYKGALPWKPLSGTFGRDETNVDVLRKMIGEQTFSEFPGLWNSIEVLQQRMMKANRLLNQEPYALLPHLPCHGDFAPANLLALGNKVTGIIDFECSRWASRVYDISTFLLSLQQGEGYEAIMSSWFIEGYQSILSLSDLEITSIPIFQTICSLEAAKRHLNRVIRGNQQMLAGLIMYWERTTAHL